MARNIRLYPWFQACKSLLFWQAIWFLYFQTELSAAEAVLLAAVYDLSTTALEVPSGYLADRVGRRATLIAASLATACGCLVLGVGGAFWVFALGQVLLGTGSAFVSGADSALLYDSLKATGREEEVAAQEVRAWRFGFGGLAVSAVTGGLIALHAPALTYFGAAGGMMGALWIATRFREPPVSPGETAGLSVGGQSRVVLARLSEHSLAWFFAVAVAMYVFSHVPFVFGQPFIEQALARFGLSADAPAVSGAIVSAMMLVSVASSWFALPLTRALGARHVILCALGLQVALVAMLAATAHVAAVAVLLLRMVPNAFARPLILAGVQPQLERAYRATFLSLQSLLGRVILAGTLLLVSETLPSEGVLTHAALRQVLPWYVAVGAAVLAVLAWLGRRAKPPAH
ncbi:MAG: MFS transporter [Alphaproteobacteria bacterium]|nr:MFS transporter [Alphaproteobacteria bacterium]MCB9931349.1 MFS transporter [Alphaproteobacteria bacterium]